MTLKYVLLPYLLTAFIATGIIALVIIAVRVIKDRKKEIPVSINVTSQVDESTYSSLEKNVAAIAEMLKSHITPKPVPDLKASLCGTWTNADDSMRYYITSRGGFYLLYVEDRYALDQTGKTYVIRCTTSNPDDRHIFFADGDECVITFAYSPEQDRIFLPDSNEELERYMDYIREPDDDEKLSSIKFDLNSFTSNS